MDEEQAQKIRTKYTLMGFLIGILFTLALCVAGVLMRDMIQNKKLENAQLAARDTEVKKDEKEEPVAGKETREKMRTMQDIIDNYYYLHDVTTEELEDGMYHGMIEALGDDYATYLSVEEREEFSSQNEGTYYGIGCYIGINEETKYPIISGVMEGSPAEEADLHVNDTIVKVEDTVTYDMALEDVVAMVRGEEDTVVNLTVDRDGESLVIPVTRRKVNRPTVSSKMLEDGIGYIAISEFDMVTIDQFTEEYAEIKAENPKGLILDLRGNPGGLVEAVVKIGNQILPKGRIFYTEDKQGNVEEYTSDGEHEIQIPLVVLVNGGSASASEILTGAVKDYGIGTIVGTKTFGKGIVQKLFELSDGSAIKMTVSAYYTPNGHNIHGTGIEPDVEIEFDSDRYYESDKTEYNQLEKAIEILKEKM